MRPQTCALAVYRGDTYRWRFVLWADAAKTQPADLTGVTVRAEIHQYGAHGHWHHEANWQVIPLAVTVTGNQVDLVLSKEASQRLAPVTSAWDLQLTYPSGDQKTVMRGAVQVRADMTGSRDLAIGVPYVA